MRKFLIKIPENAVNGETFTVKICENEKNAAILETENGTEGFEVIAEITGNDFYSDEAIKKRGGKLLTFEVERRWLVKIPENIDDFRYESIEQDYLAPESGFQGRIRKLDGKYIYTEKARTGSSAVRIENEREITEEEYLSLKKHTIMNTIKKRRYIIPCKGYRLAVIGSDKGAEVSSGPSRKVTAAETVTNGKGQGSALFELDVFENTAESGIGIMEIELENENDPVDIPEFIEIIQEVTNDQYYTNRNLASMDKIRFFKPQN